MANKESGLGTIYWWTNDSPPIANKGTTGRVEEFIVEFTAEADTPNLFDEVACKAFSHNLKLQRTITLIEGGEMCDFRVYAIEEDPR